MKAWYVIGIVMALIPLFFRIWRRLSGIQAVGAAGSPDSHNQAGGEDA